jgi:hypothetical protein
MRIIYDSEKKSEERVTIEDYFIAGKEMPVGCFEIKLEFSLDGKPHSEIRLARWGDLKKRKESHRVVWDHFVSTKAKARKGS